MLGQQSIEPNGNLWESLPVKPLRRVRSFVLREGRITAAQRRALESLASTYCIGADRIPLDLDAHFGRYAPRHLEIGCGVGEVLIALARQHPENHYLGVEVYRPSLGSLLRRLAEERVPQVRLLCNDAALAFETQIEDESLDAIYIFFPDPWPKKRHRKRRLIQPGFAALLRKRLKAHGRVFIATDWEDYAHHILKVMEEAGFINLAGEARFAPRPTWRPVTRYERRALALGHLIRDLVFAQASQGGPST